MPFRKSGNLVEEYETVTNDVIRNVYDLTKIQAEMASIQSELDNWDTLRAADKAALQSRLVDLGTQLTTLQNV